MLVNEHPPLVLCVWDDAWVSGTEAVTLQNVGDKHRPSRQQTVGWLLLDDDKGVSIANERCLDEGEEEYRGRTFILRVLIRSVTPVLRPKLIRKKRLLPPLLPIPPTLE